MDLQQQLDALAERVDALEARLDTQHAAHERALETRDREADRLRDQLRDEEYQRYTLEREVASLKNDLDRSRRGW